MVTYTTVIKRFSLLHCLNYFKALKILFNLLTWGSEITLGKKSWNGKCLEYWQKKKKFLS